MKTISYVPPEHHETYAPLWFGEAYPAFLQLDCRTGEVTYDVRWEPGKSEEEIAGHVLRWSVPPNLLGGRLKAIFNRLASDLQIVLDGYSQDYEEYSTRTRGELDDEAQAAEKHIRSTIFDASFFSHDVAEVWTADEMAEWADDAINPSMTDDEIETLALECELHFEDRVLLVGSAVRAFRERRDSLR